MPDKQYQREALDIYNTSKVQYIHDIKEVKEMKSHTHTRVVVIKMRRVVVISQEALPWVCPSQNRGGRF